MTPTLRLRPSLSSFGGRLRVVDPATGRPLSDGGAAVEESTYWLRRLRDGDVEEVSVEAPEAPEEG